MMRNPLPLYQTMMIDAQENSRISIRMLRYFQVLANELHFGRAASQLNISQPPLSVQIKELEDILSVKLLDRTSRTVVLTHAGRVLKTEVDRILNATETSLNYVRQIGRNEHQHLNIGIIGTALWGGVLPRLKTFHQQYPQAIWTLQELTQHQQLEALKNHTIDIAINRNLAVHVPAGVSHQHIARESIIVALSDQDSLCKQEQLTLNALSSRPFISLSFTHSDFAQQLYDYCVDAGFYPLIAHQVSEPQTALALVSAGIGIALLPDSCALIQWPGVKFVPLTESIPADLYALWQTDNKTAIAAAFLAALSNG